MIYLDFENLNEYYGREDGVLAAECLEGLIQGLKKGGYKKGNRNNIAVDLCCLCYMFDIDPIEVFNEYVHDHFNRLDFKERAIVIDRYCEDWTLRSANGVFDFMFNVFDKVGASKFENVSMIGVE